VWNVKMAFILSKYDDIDLLSLSSSERKFLFKEIRKTLKERIVIEKQILTLVKTFNDRI
jgi:hypothetical protein